VLALWCSTLLASSLPAAALAAQQADRQPSNDAWRIVQPPQSSLVLARDGSLIGEIGSQWRTSVPLSSLPRYLPQAFIAVEDQRFYQHDGVDIIGIAGALRDALRGNLRGASTITQQLVGNMHPDLVDRSDRSPLRKLREQAAAREMERHYTKEQILEAYLNQIHFGHRWYGVEAAARHYFGKSASQLSLAEAATLAALPKGPAIYDPIAHPDRARARRNLVLSLMAEQGFISRQQAEEAKREPLVVVSGAGFSAPSMYFVDVVRIQAERAGFQVSTGGYRIRTTLDPVLQRAAVQALSEGLAEIENRPGYRHSRYGGPSRRSGEYLQGAVVALDPYTGDVRALVGGRDYAASPFNRAVDGLRQPGSAFKPVVYLAALEAGLPPNAIVADTALAIPLQNSTLYRPSNSDGQFLGLMTLREALALSRNTVAIQLALYLGLDRVAAMARRLGLAAPIPLYPSSAIGAAAVQPLDLVAAYAAIANLGARVEARFITSIEDATGRTVWSNPINAPQQVLAPQVAFLMRDMLRDVVERGTATAVRRYVPPEIPVAGKTGTTDDNSDVWFVGMTPGIVAGVWLGFDRPKPIAPGAAGGTLAAPIFGRMVQRAQAWRAGAPWTVPSGVIAAELDRRNGALAEPATPSDRRYLEYFLPGTEPLPLRLDSWGVFRGLRTAVP
jgi:1A family penicillin-binding protein